VACAPRDSIHYYDMFFHKGPEWYAAHFEGAQSSQLLFDTTPSYLRSLRAPERMYRDNPDAKLALTMRHPVERAFSHYWQERKNPQRHYEFSEVLSNYDFYASWLEPGFYAEHIERYLEYFPRDQLLCQRFDLLEQNPRAFLRALLEFLAIDADFTPSWIDTRLNEAKVVRNLPGRIRVKVRRGLTRALGTGFLNSAVAKRLTESAEYNRGVPADVHNELLEHCLPEIERTEQLLGLDLSEWKAAR